MLSGGNGIVGCMMIGNINVYFVDGFGIYFMVVGCNFSGNNNFVVMVYGVFV